MPRREGRSGSRRCRAGTPVDPLLNRAVVVDDVDEQVPVHLSGAEERERLRLGELVLDAGEVGLRRVAGILRIEQWVDDRHRVVEGEHDRLGRGEHATPSQVPQTAKAPKVTSPAASSPSTASQSQPTSSGPEHCGGYDSMTGPRQNCGGVSPVWMTVPWPTTWPGCRDDVGGEFGGSLGVGESAGPGRARGEQGDGCGGGRQRGGATQGSGHASSIENGGRSHHPTFQATRPSARCYPGAVRFGRLLLSCRDEV